MESLDANVKRVKTFIETQTATRLILKAESSAVKRLFLEKLFQVVEENDVSYDVLWLNRENEKVKVDDARRTSEFLSYAPSQAKRKYVISEELSNATPEAIAALLKITEEPPDFAVFIFFASNPTRVISTIRSRFTILDLNIDPKSLMEPTIAQKIKGGVLEDICASNSEFAIHISKNFERVFALFDGAKDTFSTLAMIKKLSEEEFSTVEISILIEKLLLFLKKEEIVEVFQALKDVLNAKNSLKLFKAFVDAALVILEDLVILKRTSYWKGIKRKDYIKYYVDMNCPLQDDLDWLLRLSNKDRYAKTDAGMGIFLVLSKFVILKGK